VAACRECLTELELRAVGCARCNPSVDLSVLADLERHPRWAEAAHHHMRSSRATFLLLGAAAALLGLLLLWPSYRDAVAAGDTSGRPLMIGGGVLAGVLIVAGVLSLLARLRRHPAIVLTTTFYTTTDSEGGDTTHYGVHLRTRSRPLALSAARAQIEALKPGDAVIAFERRGHLEDVWPIATAARPAAPRTRMPRSSARHAVAAPPVALTARDPGVRPAVDDAAARAAVAEMARLDFAAVDHARDARVTPPLFAFLGAMLWAGAGIFAIVAPRFVEATTAGPSPGVDPAAYAERLRIVTLVATTLGVLMLVLAVVLAVRTGMQPIVRILLVVLDRRVVRTGGRLITSLDIVDPDGLRRELRARRGIVAPLGTPVIAYAFAGTVFATREVERTDAHAAAPMHPDHG